MATSDSEATESDGSDTAPLRPHNQLDRERLQHRPTEHHNTMGQPEGQGDTLSMRTVIEEFRKKSTQALVPPSGDMTPPLPPRKTFFDTELPVASRSSHSGHVSYTSSCQRTSRATEIHDDSTDTDEDRRANKMAFIRQRRLTSSGRNQLNSLKKGIVGERYQVLSRPQQERRSSLLSRRIDTDINLSSPATPTVTEASKRPYPSSCSEAGDETESDTETTRLLRRLYWRIDYLEKERTEYLDREQGYQTQILNLAGKVTQLEAHLDKARMVIMGPGSNAAPSGDGAARTEVSCTMVPKQAHSPGPSLCLPLIGQFGK
ncbi:hypothetical protein BGZ81_002628 [Podila clonocystis]|nr:hypothetical protein BGZ81_002628 [Podila clonocystis]